MICPSFPTSTVRNRTAQACCAPPLAHFWLGFFHAAGFFLVLIKPRLRFRFVIHLVHSKSLITGFGPNPGIKLWPRPWTEQFPPGPRPDPDPGHPLNPRLGLWWSPAQGLLVLSSSRRIASSCSVPGTRLGTHTSPSPVAREPEERV